MREIIIDSANKILSKSISSLQYSTYISICLDGGKVSQRHFIDFVAWMKSMIFSIFVKDTESLNIQLKLSHFFQKIEKLSEVQNKIVCFVVDGLRAQVAGLDPKSKESFHHRNGI